MKGTFYIVGVGPGDPQLMTLKAVRVMERCPVWLTPTARKNGPSTALDIVRGVVDESGHEILAHHFPMKKVERGRAADPAVQHAWDEAVRLIGSHLTAGRDVALPTLGDPAIYSTGLYICENLQAHDEAARVEIIPGISAIGATAAAALTPLCLGNERLLVIPAIFEDERVRRCLEECDVAVFMKVHKSLERLVPLLAELDLLDNAVLVERTSMAEERVRRDLRRAMTEEIHYFSTLIVRKPHGG